MQYMTKRVEKPSYIHFLSKDGKKINGTRHSIHMDTEDTLAAEAVISEIATLYHFPKDVCIEYTLTYDEPVKRWIVTCYLPRE